MAQQVENWNTIGGNKGTGNQGQRENRPPRPKAEYLKLSGSKEHNIRPLGLPVCFHKYFVKDSTGKPRSAITNDPSTCPVAMNHGLKPSKRYAINVIDRKDSKVKVIEGPNSIFKAFRQYFEETTRNPGGANSGADFKISVTGTGEETRYETKFVKRTPLTDDEKAMVHSNIYDLTALYAETPKDRIEKYLFGPPKNTGPARGTPAAQKGLDDDDVPAAGDDVAPGKEVDDDDNLDDDLKF